MPQKLVIALAALIVFYRGEIDGKTIAVQDEAFILTFFADVWGKYNAKTIDAAGIAKAVLANKEFWGEDLNEIKGLTDATANYLSQILDKGMMAVVKSSIGECGCK